MNKLCLFRILFFYYIVKFFVAFLHIHQLAVAVKQTTLNFSSLNNNHLFFLMSLWIGKELLQLA